MYGHGLADCISEESMYVCGPNPSKFAYPNLVATAFNCECVNLSSPGSGTLDVLLKILSFNYKKDDVVVVQWPSVGTATLISENGNNINVQPWMAEESLKILKHTDGAGLIKFQAEKSKMQVYEQLDIAKNFYKIHSDKHLSITNCLYMDHAAHHLDSIGIKKIFGGAETWDFTDSPVPDRRVMKNHGTSFVDLASDGQHPGPKWHKQIAEEIINLIQNFL
jgi:hypothetical protein